MAVGRITGPLLKSNLLRRDYLEPEQANLAFETDLLYLDVINGRIGINVPVPLGDTSGITHDLTVNGTTRTNQLIVDTQAEIATFTIVGDTISSSSDTINLIPSTSYPVVYQGTIVTGNLELSTNVIETTGTNTDLTIQTTGTGEVNINANVNINGDLYVTGNLRVDGDVNGEINIGDTNTDNVVFNAEIDSDVFPNVNNTFDLGSDPGNLAGSNPLATGKAWQSTYTHNLFSTNISADQIFLNDIDIRLPQGQIYYVAVNGSDTNAGVHENDPLATIKYALSLATSGDSVFIYPGTYTEEFPLTVPVGVTVRGAGIRAVTIKPTTATKYNDAFLLNGETTIEDLSVADFFSGGNYFTVTAASAGSTTVNVGTAAFAHTYVSGGTITIGATSYNITNADYTYYTGELVITHTGGTASPGNSVFVSNLTFSCNGSDRVFPDNGYAFRFADNFRVTSRSPYVRNCTVLTKGTTSTPSSFYVTSSDPETPAGVLNRTLYQNGTLNGKGFYQDDEVNQATIRWTGSQWEYRVSFVPIVLDYSLDNTTYPWEANWIQFLVLTPNLADPLGFDSGDAGKGAYIDGAYANSASKEASMLFHSVTFITPNVDCITAKNGVRVEWLNSFTYFANRGIHAISSAYGFARQGQTRLRIDSKTGTWNVGNTVTYYDTDGTTVLASGTISSVDGNYINLTGKCVGFQTITDRAGKTVFANGDAKLTTITKKFGSASLSLDGTGDFANIGTNPDFEFGTGNFCIEAWIYPTATGTYRTIFDFRSASGDTGGIILGLSDINALYFYFNGNYRIGPVGSVLINTWTHVALAKHNGVTRAFINGTQVGADYTDSNNYLARGLRIGADPNGAYAFPGYIDDVRISKGVSRYNSNFTAPTSALLGDLNTVLLLHFNGTNNSTTFLDDGVTLQDLRVTNGGPTIGTASLINFADYSDFGAEIRAIGSANVYGNYGIVGDGDGVIAYLISQNFAYVGAGKLSTNDPNDRIAANEVVKLNRAKIYYTSVDNEGNFKVGDAFYVNQKTGDVLFNNQSLTITAPEGVIFTDGVNTTTLLPTNIDTGNMRISGNTIESLTGNVNIVSANNTINLQNNTFVTGTLDVTGNVTLNGDIQIGNASTDNINFIGSINSNLIPSTTATYDLGRGGVTPLRWKNAYLNRIEIDGVVIDNNTISTTIGNDDLQLIANGTGRIYIPSSDVQINQNLTVTQDFTVTTGTSYLKNIGITGTVTQVGDINQTGNFTSSGNTTITGNITGTGYLQLPVITISGNTIQTTTTNTDLVLQANGTGNVVFEGLKVQDNNIQSTVTDSNIILTPQGTGSVVVNSDQSLIIPVGTTAERPASPLNGMVRYNTDTSRYEARANGYWIKLGGVEDVSGNTRILAESTPGANDNIIYFYANNTLTATIDNVKLFTERFQTNNLDIYDNTITPLLSNSDINLVTGGTGGVKIGNLRVRNNTITNVVSNAITEFVQTGQGYVKIAGTNGVVIPAGDSQNDRPALKETGMMRFNTELGLVEVWTGLVWTSVAGISSGITAAEAADIGIQMVLTLG